MFGTEEMHDDSHDTMQVAHGKIFLRSGRVGVVASGVDDILSKRHYHQIVQQHCAQ